MPSVAPIALPTRAATAHGRFHRGMALSFLLVAVVGFAPTYWIPMVRGTLAVPAITHLHAVFFYGWLLFYLRQSALVAADRVGRHREFGVLGVAIATAMCFVGLGAAINSLNRLDAAGLGATARPFSIVSMTAIALFAVLFAVAIVNVKRPEIHKRVMLAATASLLQAAVGRWFLLLLAPDRPAGFTGPVVPPPVAVSLLPGLLVDLFIVAGMVHDRRTRGRVHPAYWMAGSAVVAVQVLRIPLSATDLWMRMTHWLQTLAP